MKSPNPFLEVMRFFQNAPGSRPGSPDYNKAFCDALVNCTQADAASIWQTDEFDQLHLVASTDIPLEQARDIVLSVGEGIGGAAALSRQPVSVVNAQTLNFHDSRIDTRFGLQTYAMISAPVVFENRLFGVVNVLNHRAGKTLDPSWTEWLFALAVLYAATLAQTGTLKPYEAAKWKRDGRKHKTTTVAAETVIVGISPAVQNILHLCFKAGTTDIPVLIYGETGTGKELAARRIHETSLRSRGPFIDINCAALSETLLESELFGHVKGAFTGANHYRAGKFLAASGGTLFLDEIGDMSDACQAKILRVLEEKKVTPVGSEKSISSDVRIIAATNKNLKEMIREKKFREDLYYRLCGIEITIPPLCERTGDIHLLALHCLNRMHARQKSTARHKAPRLTPGALERIESYSWPGNVRQLEQALYAAATLCEGDEIKISDLPAWLQQPTGTRRDLHSRIELPPDPLATPAPSLRGLSAEESSRYRAVLEDTRYRGTGRWNISAAARKLGIPRETLAYRLRRM